MIRRRPSRPCLMSTLRLAWLSAWHGHLHVNLSPCPLTPANLDKNSPICILPTPILNGSRPYFPLPLGHIAGSAFRRPRLFCTRPGGLSRSAFTRAFDPGGLSRSAFTRKP